jgi:hypothetical protein
MARKLVLVTGFVQFRQGLPVYGKAEFGSYQGPAGEERRPILTSFDGSVAAWLPGHANLVRLLERTTPADALEIVQAGQQSVKTPHGTKAVWQYHVSVLEPREVSELTSEQQDVGRHLSRPSSPAPAAGKKKPPAREPGEDG